jgi:hypothetical protein
MQFSATQEKTIKEEACNFFLIHLRDSIPKKGREARPNRQKIDIIAQKMTELTA